MKGVEIRVYHFQTSTNSHVISLNGDTRQSFDWNVDGAGETREEAIANFCELNNFERDEIIVRDK